MRVLIIMFLVAATGYAAKLKGDFGDTAGKLIGVNNGTYQIIVTSEEAANALTDYLLYANENNADNIWVVVATATWTNLEYATNTTTARRYDNGFLKMSFPILPGGSISPDGENGSAVYGICPYSSGTIHKIALRKMKPGKDHIR